MRTYEAERKELAKELMTYKKAYRKNSLEPETARYIAREIHTLKQLIEEN